MARVRAGGRVEGINGDVVVVTVTRPVSASSLTFEQVGGRIVVLIHGTHKHQHQVAARVHIGCLQVDADGVFAAGVYDVSIKDQAQLGGGDVAIAEVTLVCAAHIDLGGSIGHIVGKMVVNGQRSDGSGIEAQLICQIQSFVERIAHPEVHGEARQFIARADGNGIGDGGLSVIVSGSGAKRSGHSRPCTHARPTDDRECVEAREANHNHYDQGHQSFHIMISALRWHLPCLFL